MGEDCILKICVLASSSSGNASFIATDKTRILIDAGLSRREIFQRLAAIGEDPYKLDAVVISHEHGDHVCGLIAVLRKLSIPVYLSRLTAPTIDWNQYTPKLETFQAGERLRIGDLEIDTFTIPHDAVDPVGFSIRAHGIKVSIVTDLGYVPDSIRMHLRGSDFLVLESNHDLEMLKVGPYPWSVKQRVMGRNGHLSNEVVSDFIRDGLDSCLHTLVLGHLSEHNNHPEIVRLVASQALTSRGLAARLVVAEPKKQSEVFQY
ncbi:MAG TPA: MBL fold metallo-hydrolase [Bryobacteraceae bacterium]|nr:MBL fold metallo-hydrolase [Bryobacteraceae bacterium]